MSITRTLAITYGSVTIGSGGNYHLGDIEIQKDRKSLTVVFTAIITEATESALYTRISDLEDEFRKRDQDLVLDRGSSSETYSHSDNSGFNMEPGCKELESEFVGLSREFQCSVSLGLPEDGSSTDGELGLRNHAVSVTKQDTNRREIKLQGVYTALSGNGAKDQYDSQIETLSDNVKDDIDLNAEWELIEDTTEKDREDKFCSFVRVFIENLAKQSVAQTDVPELKNVQLAASVLDNAPGDFDQTVAGTRPITVAVSYSASVDKEVSVDLREKFDSLILPRMIEYGQQIGGGTRITLTEVDFKPNQGSNTIEADIVMVVYGGDSILSVEVKESDDETPGYKIEPVDDGASSYSGDIIPAQALFIRQTLTTIVVLGTLAEARAKLDQVNLPSVNNEPGQGDGKVVGNGGAIDVSEIPKFGVEGGVFIPQNRREIDAGTEFIGIPPHQLQISAVSQVVTSRYFVQAQKQVGVGLNGGASGGSGGRIRTVTRR